VKITVLALIYAFTSFVFALQYYARKSIIEMLEMVMGTRQAKRRMSRSFYLVSKASVIINYGCSLYILLAIVALMAYMAFYAYAASLLYFIVVALLAVALRMAFEGAASSYKFMPILKSFRYTPPTTKDANPGKPESDR